MNRTFSRCILASLALAAPSTASPETRHPPTAPALAASPASLAPAATSAAPTAADAGADTDRDLTARADALVARRAFAEADALLGATASPAAALVRARALQALGDLAGSEAAARDAQLDPELAPWAAVELALVALQHGDTKAALALVGPLLASHDPAVTPVVEPLAVALGRDDPETLVGRYAELEAMRASDDPDARSKLLGLEADSLRKLGRDGEATAVDLRRFLEEPVSLLTPSSPPRGVTPSAEQLLARAELLQTANRNERVVEALDALRESDLGAAQRCQRALGLGLALRKLREYPRAETELGAAVAACKGDEDRRRRALYLQAKVVSIRDGLRSIPLLEAFARRYPAHSMADDVLFWEGDLYQRRSMIPEARSTYRRIDTLAGKDDYCLEARWRLAWMSYRQGDLSGAKKGLEEMLGSGCPATSADRARGRYWLGRIAQAQGRKDDAVEQFRLAFAEDAMGFYAQVALTRLGELAPAIAKTLATTAPPDTTAELVSQACAAAVHDAPGLARAERLLGRGLRSDAAHVLLAIAPPAAEVISSTHASALGVTARYVQSSARTADPRCEREARMALALLLDRAGAYKDAAWRLRTEFAAELGALPTPATAPLWRAAYPLAWRDEIAAAEREAKLPELLLQALSREESAFDPQIVSWAGAYGLTQLLLSSGRDAGRLLTPRVTLARAEDLLDPVVNARLGGALLASLLKRFDGSAAVALAGYNAGGDAAASWWKKYGRDGLDVLAEEISIQETRGYVKRVLRTYGIYRWLYRGELPALPLEIGAAETARK